MNEARSLLVSISVLCSLQFSDTDGWAAAMTSSP